MYGSLQTPWVYAKYSKDDQRTCNQRTKYKYTFKFNVSAYTRLSVKTPLSVKEKRRIVFFFFGFGTIDTGKLLHRQRAEKSQDYMAENVVKIICF